MKRGQGSRNMKTLGVIGRLGSMATVYFMELVIAMTDVDHDQQHFLASFLALFIEKES